MKESLFRMVFIEKKYFSSHPMNWNGLPGTIVEDTMKLMQKISIKNCNNKKNEQKIWIDCWKRSTDANVQVETSDFFLHCQKVHNFDYIIHVYSRRFFGLMHLFSLYLDIWYLLATRCGHIYQLIWNMKFDHFSNNVR